MEISKITDRVNKIIKVIRNKPNISCYKMCRSAGCTYSFGTLKSRFLEEQGIITIDKIGRANQIKLTEKGEELAALISMIEQLE